MEKTIAKELTKPLWITKKGYGREFKVGDRIGCPKWKRNYWKGTIKAVDKESLNWKDVPFYWTEVLFDNYKHSSWVPTINLRKIEEAG